MHPPRQTYSLQTRQTTTATATATGATSYCISPADSYQRPGSLFFRIFYHLLAPIAVSSPRTSWYICRTLPWDPMSLILLPHLQGILPCASCTIRSTWPSTCVPFQLECTYSGTDTLFFTSFARRFCCAPWSDQSSRSDSCRTSGTHASSSPPCRTLCSGAGTAAAALNGQRQSTSTATTRWLSSSFLLPFPSRPHIPQVIRPNL